jgi:Uma2 family endonuclease
MAPTKIKPRKTVEDYLKLPESTRAELIEGELYMSPSPKFRHQRVVSNLHLALRQFAEARKLGVVLDSPMDVHLPSGDVVQPDVIFVAEAHKEILVDWIRGVPDLLIEVLSPESSERDRIVKRHLYEQNGVREYWLVDPADGSIEVLKLAGSRLVPHGYFEEGDSVSSAHLEGLSLQVRDIFA